MGHLPEATPFERSDKLNICSFPNCPQLNIYVQRAYKLKEVADAADVVMHHFADSHWNEGSFAKMVDAMEPLRLALIAAGYGLPQEGKKS